MSFCIFGEDCVKYEPYQVDGRESFRRGDINATLRLENQPFSASPGRSFAAVMLRNSASEERIWLVVFTGDEPEVA